MAARRVLHIDVVSDTICPWCYVGAKRLQKAISASAHLPLDFEIRWRPFFLDSTLPKEGKNKMEHYKAKFGAARTDMMLPMVRNTPSAQSEQASATMTSGYGSTLLGRRA